MTEYIISLFKRSYSVMLPDADENVRTLTSDRGVIISPTPIPFYDVFATTVGGENIKDWELLMLLSFFYRQLLGYPLCQISLLVDERPVNLELFDTPHGYTGVICNNCKLLYTSEYTEPTLSVHTVYTVLADRMYRVIRVKDPTLVRGDLLSGIRILKGMPTADISIAVSQGCALFFSSTGVTPGAVSAAALVLADGGPVSLLSVNDVEYRVEFVGLDTRILTPASLVRVNKI